MSHSLGRDLATEEILSSPTSSIRLVIPDVCFMEAFSTFEHERGELNKLVAVLRKQIRQSKRNVASPRILPLIDHLDKSAEELEAVFNDARDRLYHAVETLRTSAELIGLTPEILRASLTRPTT